MELRYALSLIFVALLVSMLFVLATPQPLLTAAGEYVCPTIVIGGAVALAVVYHRHKDGV